MVYVTLCLGLDKSVKDGGEYELVKVQNKGPLPVQKPLGFGLFSHKQILTNKDLH